MSLPCSEGIEVALANFPIGKPIVLQVGRELGMIPLEDNHGIAQELYPVSHHHVQLFIAAAVAFVIRRDTGSDNLVQKGKSFMDDSHCLVVRFRTKPFGDEMDDERENGQGKDREDDNVPRPFVFLHQRHLIRIALLDDTGVLDLEGIGWSQHPGVLVDLFKTRPHLLNTLAVDDGSIVIQRDVDDTVVIDISLLALLCCLTFLDNEGAIIILN